MSGIRVHTRLYSLFWEKSNSFIDDIKKGYERDFTNIVHLFKICIFMEFVKVSR